MSCVVCLAASVGWARPEPSPETPALPRLALAAGLVGGLEFDDRVLAGPALGVAIDVAVSLTRRVGVSAYGEYCRPSIFGTRQLVGEQRQWLLGGGARFPVAFADVPISWLEIGAGYRQHIRHGGQSVTTSRGLDVARLSWGADLWVTPRWGLRIGLAWSVGWFFQMSGEQMGRTLELGAARSPFLSLMFGLSGILAPYP